MALVGTVATSAVCWVDVVFGHDRAQGHAIDPALRSAAQLLLGENSVGLGASDVLVFEVLLLAGAVGMGIAGAGAALVHAFRKEARIATRIKKSSPQTIGGFRDGTEGRICGRASASQMLRAPLSGRECIAYELTVETKGFENDNIWGVRHRHSHATEFTLEDKLGSSASVVPEPVETWLTPDFLVNNGEGRNDLLHEVLRGIDHDLPDSIPIRVHEAILQADENLVVVGIGRLEPDPAPDSPRTYRSTPTHLVIRGSVKLPVLLTNRWRTER